jgi:hypothetical protein
VDDPIGGLVLHLALSHPAPRRHFFSRIADSEVTLAERLHDGGWVGGCFSANPDLRKDALSLTEARLGERAAAEHAVAPVDEKLKERLRALGHQP